MNNNTENSAFFQRENLKDTNQQDGKPSISISPEIAKRKTMLNRINLFHVVMMRLMLVASCLALFFTIINYNNIITVITGLFILAMIAALAVIAKKQKDALIDVVILDALKK